MSDSGLVISPHWPFIGASPDGIVECNCCGRGVLEIKCPYSHRGEDLLSAVISDKQFCLIQNDDGSLQLDHGHAYYYQVQTQMFICDVDYCDFSVFTFPTEVEEASPHIERIFKDADFWETCLEKARCFFRTCLLPEILGHWYTRPLVKSSSSSDSATTSQSVQLDDNAANSSQGSELFCYCRGPEEGSMIACDNHQCKIEWFHQSCLKLNAIPRGKWYCPDCRKLPQFLKGKKKK